MRNVISTNGRTNGKIAHKVTKFSLCHFEMHSNYWKLFDASITRSMLRKWNEPLIFVEMSPSIHLFILWFDWLSRTDDRTNQLYNWTTCCVRNVMSNISWYSDLHFHFDCEFWSDFVQTKPKCDYVCNDWQSNWESEHILNFKLFFAFFPRMNASIWNEIIIWW